MNLPDTALPPCRARHGELRWDALVFFTSLLLYALTLHIGPGGRAQPGDAAKFQYIGLVLGVPHAPGYPLYVLSTWLWTRLPSLLSHATMVNLLSAFYTAAALVVFRRALRALGVSTVITLLFTAALMSAPRVWLRATEAGPGSLSVLLACAMLWAVFHLAVTGSTAAYAAVLALTLIAAGHDTALLWWAPCVLIVATCWAPGAWRNRMTWLALAAGLLLGPGAHLYVYLRSWQTAPVLEYVGPRAPLARVIAHMLGAQFWPNYWHLGPRAMLAERVPLVLGDLTVQLHYAGAALAAPGLLWAWVRLRRPAVFLTLMLAAGALPALHMFAPQPAAHAWLVVPAAACCAALGMQAICAYAGRLRGALLVLCAAWVLQHAAVSAQLVTRRAADYHWRDLLLAMPSPSIMLTADIYTTREVLAYYHWTDRFVRQRVIGVRDALDGSVAAPVFFHEPSVHEAIHAEGLPSALVYSNAHGVLSMLTAVSP